MAQPLLYHTLLKAGPGSSLRLILVSTHLCAKRFWPSARTSALISLAVPIRPRARGTKSQGHWVEVSYTRTSTCNEQT